MVPPTKRDKLRGRHGCDYNHERRRRSSRRSFSVRVWDIERAPEFEHGHDLGRAHDFQYAHERLRRLEPETHLFPQLSIPEGDEWDRRPTDDVTGRQDQHPATRLSIDRSRPAVRCHMETIQSGIS